MQKIKFKAIARALSSKYSLMLKLNPAFIEIFFTENDLVTTKYFEQNQSSSLFKKQSRSLSFFI